MDIENGTEVFRVPQQKDKEPMDVMNDFFAVSVESVLRSFLCKFLFLKPVFYKNNYPLVFPLHVNPPNYFKNHW